MFICLRETIIDSGTERMVGAAEYKWAKEAMCIFWWSFSVCVFHLRTCTQSFLWPLPDLPLKNYSEKICGDCFSWCWTNSMKAVRPFTWAMYLNIALLMTDVSVVMYICLREYRGQHVLVSQICVYDCLSEVEAFWLLCS